MRKFVKAHIPELLLTLIILISMAGIVFWGQKKEGFHMDEIYSFGLSNSEYLPFMHMGNQEYSVKDWMAEYGAGENPVELLQNLWKDFQILKENHFRFKDTVIYQQYLRAQANSADIYSSTWMTGQDYLDYLTAGNGNRFNYASVYYNQRGDVHPPLFYILLHTICSVVTGSYSKWLGLGLNMVLLAAAMVGLYFLVKTCLENEQMALAVTACYGFARGFMTTALLIRMYSLLTLFVVLTCLVHLRIMKEGYTFHKKQRRLLFFVTLFGFLTHYYYVLYAIALSAVVSVILMISKKWKEMLRFWITLGVSAVVGLCVWPFAVKHVFGGYRGQDALGKLQSGLFHPTYVFVVLEQVVEELLGGHWWLLLIPVLAAMVFVIQAIRKKEYCRQTVWKVAVIYIPAVLYFLVVTQIVPILIDRYVMCVYPFILLSIVWGAAYLAKELYYCGMGQKWIAGKWNERHFVTGMICLAAAIVVASGCWFWRTPGYLFPGGQNHYRIEEGTDCVFVLPDGSWNASADSIPFLAKCDQVLVTHEMNVDWLCQQYTYEPGTPLLVAVYRGEDAIKTKDHVLEAMNVTGLEIQDVWAWAGTQWMLLK